MVTTGSRGAPTIRSAASGQRSSTSSRGEFAAFAASASLLLGRGPRAQPGALLPLHYIEAPHFNDSMNVSQASGSWQKISAVIRLTFALNTKGM